METIQPTLRNGRNIYDQINMPKSEFEARIRSIRKEMKKESIDVFLAYGAGFNEYGNSCYLSNFINRLVTNGAIILIPKKGDIVLMIEGTARGLPSAKATTWIKDVRVSADLSKACVNYLQENRMIPSSVGFAGLKEFMPHHQLAFLYDSLKQCEIIDADEILKYMRMMKSPKEMDQIRRASAILNHVFTSLKEMSFNNLTERILEAILFRESRLEKAEDFRMLIGKPDEEGFALHPPGEATLSDGSVIIYLSVEYERYWAEATRTFILKDGSFTDATSESLQSIHESVIGKMTPGKTISQFYKDAMAGMKKGKFECITDYGLGHGIGLSPREYPIMNNKDNTMLKEGMCLTFRLLLRDKELGAYMVGNTIELTKKGPELLTC